MPKSKPWYSHIARALAVLFGAGFIGMAITVGIYKQKVDRMELDLATFKIIHEFDKRLSVLEERTKGANSSVPLIAPAVLRPTAGKQR